MKLGVTLAAIAQSNLRSGAAQGACVRCTRCDSQPRRSFEQVGRLNSNFIQLHNMLRWSHCTSLTLWLRRLMQPHNRLDLKPLLCHFCVHAENASTPGRTVVREEDSFDTRKPLQQPAANGLRILLLLAACSAAAGNTACASMMPGDFKFTACSSFCNAEKHTNHCKVCVCARAYACARVHTRPTLSASNLPFMR